MTLIESKCYLHIWKNKYSFANISHIVRILCKLIRANINAELSFKYHLQELYKRAGRENCFQKISLTISGKLLFKRPMNQSINSFVTRMMLCDNILIDMTKSLDKGAL